MHNIVLGFLVSYVASQIEFLVDSYKFSYYHTLNNVWNYVWNKLFFVSLLYPPYPKDRGMLWFYVEAARRPPPAARNGVNAIAQKPRDGLFSNLVYTLVVIVSWPD